MIPHISNEQIVAWIGSLSLIVTAIAAAVVKISAAIREVLETLHGYEGASFSRDAAVLKAVKKTDANG